MIDDNDKLEVVMPIIMTTTTTMAMMMMAMAMMMMMKMMIIMIMELNRMGRQLVALNQGMNGRGGINITSPIRYSSLQIIIFYHDGHQNGNRQC